MRIDVHIDRLVLDETLTAEENPVLTKETLERDLVRWLAAPGAPNALRAVGTVDALPLVPLPAAKHRRHDLGARVAAAVAQALGVSPTEPRPSTRGGTRRESRQRAGPSRENAGRCRR